MADKILTNEVKKCADTVAIYVENNNLKTFNFLYSARSFVHKIWIELVAYGKDVSTVLKRKKKLSKYSNIIRAPQSIQQVQNIINDNPGKSMMAIKVLE